MCVDLLRIILYNSSFDFVMFVSIILAHSFFFMACSILYLHFSLFYDPFGYNMIQSTVFCVFLCIMFKQLFFIALMLLFYLSIFHLICGSRFLLITLKMRTFSFPQMKVM